MKRLLHARARGREKKRERNLSACVNFAQLVIFRFLRARARATYWSRDALSLSLVVSGLFRYCLLVGAREMHFRVACVFQFS